MTGTPRLHSADARAAGDAPDRGATAIEYALVASLVAVAVVAAVTLLGQAVLGLFQLVPAGL